MSTPYGDILAQRQKALQDAQSILLNPKASTEEVNQAKAMIGEAGKLAEQADLLKQIATDPVAEHPVQSQPDKPEAKFGSMAEYIRSAAKGLRSEGRVWDQRLKRFKPQTDEDDEMAGRGEGKALSGATAATGGVLIPEDQRAEIMALAAPLSVVRRQNPTIIRTNRRQISFRLLDQTGASTGSTSNFFGGIQVYWREEAQQAALSNPTWRKTTMTMHELIGYTEIPNELLDDADISLSDWLSGQMGFAGAIAYAEDYNFLRGDGVGKPQGIVDAPATKLVSRAISSQINYADLVNMMVGFYGQRPVWVATHLAKANLMLMAGPTATNYAGSYLWGDASAGVPDRLLGVPIFFTDKLPAVGSKGDIMLCDFSYYVIGDRQTITLDSDTSHKFRTHETALKMITRFDGQPWLTQPIKLNDGTTTVSPFVALNA
jgi:HK97 family phage major capsid protein